MDLTKIILSLSNVTKRFAKDTAYVLFYKRIHPEALTSEGYTECPQLTLREELSKAVDRDNEAYLQVCTNPCHYQ